MKYETIEYESNGNANTDKAITINARVQFYRDTHLYSLIAL